MAGGGRRNWKKVGKGAGEEEVAKKNNTGTWMSVNKQGYTNIREVYMTSSMLEYKMQMNLLPD